MGRDRARAPAGRTDCGSDGGGGLAAGAGLGFGNGPRLGTDLELAWQHTLNRLSESHRELAEDTRELEDDALDSIIPGLEYRLSALLQGVIEHGVYHGGQIAILRKTL